MDEIQALKDTYIFLSGDVIEVEGCTDKGGVPT